MRKADSGNKCCGIHSEEVSVGFRMIAQLSGKPGGLYICWVWLQAGVSVCENYHCTGQNSSKHAAYARCIYLLDIIPR